MLHIAEQNATRLMLRDRSPVLGAAMALFALLCLGLMVAAPLHNMALLLLTPRSANALRLFSLATLAVLGAVLAALGATTSAQLWRGTTCIFDRAAAAVTIIRPHGFRLRETELPIYAVSHLEIETGSEARAYALHLVLRSHERILLASVPVGEQELIETVRSRVRAFLRS